MKLPTKFGPYGGIFVPETLITPLGEIESAFVQYSTDRKFNDELRHFLKNYAGRPTPLYFAKNFSAIAGCKIYLKREDLLHGGAHKINNALGQALLAKYMGKKRLIAETGAGQHGVAVAMAGALFGLQTEIFMGSVDVRRQQQNVLKMKMCGAKVHEVTTGSCTLKDAINEALRDWTANVKETYYLFGTVAGPHPFPTIVRHFQEVIGTEARAQMLNAVGRLPDAVIACVGGGSNAIGIFHSFLDDKSVHLYGVEAAGSGLETKEHCATITKGSAGILHGSLSYVLADADGQISKTHSIAAGLDYPGVGPQHSYLCDRKRVIYTAVTDKAAVDACMLLSKTEGIIPALESSHALAYARVHAKKCRPNDIILINLSGRGDKDLETIKEHGSL